jgi:hypothetical protein
MAGQKTLAMAIHYSETADTSARMKNVIGDSTRSGANSERNCLARRKISLTERGQNR